MDATVLLFAVGVQFFLSAIVAAAVADDKNRSGIGFFFLGLFFLTVGLDEIANPRLRKSA